MKKTPNIEEASIDELFAQVKSENSELQRIRLLYAAYCLYGDGRKPQRGPQFPNLGNSKADFIKMATAQTGHGKSTIYDLLKHGKTLKNLPDEVVQACLGTPLANDREDLLALARVPDRQKQLELVARYEMEREEVRAELNPVSSAQGDEIPSPADEGNQEEEPDVGSDQTVRTGESSEPADDDEIRPASRPSVDPAVLELLGVADSDEILPAVQRLVAEKLEAQNRCKQLESELTVYRTAPLGQMFNLLGVKTAKGAVDAVTALKVVANG